MSGFLTSIPNLGLLTFRDAIREISPRWLRRGSPGSEGLSQRILYAFGLHFDAVAAATTDGVKRRFPQLLDSIDALGLIGQSRRHARGSTEIDQLYMNRLMQWLDNHRIRGGPYALLHQLGIFWSLAPFDIDLVYESGKRFHFPAFGAITDSIGDPWDTDTDAWARWWLIYEWPGVLADDGVWSDPGVWDDGGVWDSGLSGADVRNIRLLPNEWNAAHARGYVTLNPEGLELWDIPAGLWSDPGDWGDGAVDPVTIAVA